MGKGQVSAAQGTGWRERSPCTCESLSLSPKGSELGLCSPTTLASDLLQAPSGLPGQGLISSSAGPKESGAGTGSREAPWPLPLRCMDILSAPMGATRPRLWLLRAQLHTSGKGTTRPQAPAFPRPHPGVCPPPAPPPGRNNQGGRVDSVLQLRPQWGKGGSDRSDAVPSRAPGLRKRRGAMASICLVSAGSGSTAGSSSDQEKCALLGTGNPQSNVAPA